MPPPLDAPAAIPAGFEHEPRLVDALRSGDEDAFAWLVRRYHGPLLRYAAVFVSDRAVAEEVVQETWLGVIRGIGAFEARSSVRTWLFHILANRARTRGAREARSVPMSALAAQELEDDAPVVGADHFRPNDAPRWAGHWAIAPQPWNAPEARLLAAETRAVLDAAITALPPVQRQVITLRDVLGLDPEETCERMGLTDGNQRVLLHRARTRVRAALDAYLRTVEAT
ncbi:MAG TPA: sigma-70 family RNA polymerase sigma factor [Miltoncostaea sp.]|nr:sigma-70 family RNA polymerase sigma factor [Miltoncostaea sp.]